MEIQIDNQTSPEQLNQKARPSVGPSRDQRPLREASEDRLSEQEEPTPQFNIKSATRQGKIAKTLPHSTMIKTPVVPDIDDQFRKLRIKGKQDNDVPASVCDSDDRSQIVTSVASANPYQMSSDAGSMMPAEEAAGLHRAQHIGGVQNHLKNDQNYFGNEGQSAQHSVNALLTSNYQGQNSDIYARVPNNVSQAIQAANESQILQHVGQRSIKKNRQPKEYVVPKGDFEHDRQLNPMGFPQEIIEQCLKYKTQITSKIVNIDQKIKDKTDDEFNRYYSNQKDEEKTPGPLDPNCALPEDAFSPRTYGDSTAPTHLEPPTMQKFKSGFTASIAHHDNLKSSFIQPPPLDKANSHPGEHKVTMSDADDSSDSSKYKPVTVVQTTHILANPAQTRLNKMPHQKNSEEKQGKKINNESHFVPSSASPSPLIDKNKIQASSSPHKFNVNLPIAPSIGNEQNLIGGTRGVVNSNNMNSERLPDIYSGNKDAVMASSDLIASAPRDPAEITQAEGEVPRNNYHSSASRYSPEHAVQAESDKAKRQSAESRLVTDKITQMFDQHQFLTHRAISRKAAVTNSLEPRAKLPAEKDDENLFLLPVQQPSRKRGKKTLVLDLDETLVHSQFKPVANADFILTINISNIPNQVMNQKVYACKRPFCDEFLEAVAPHFEIVMFTASLSRYAEPLFKKLDPNDKIIDHCLYREHCTQYKRDFYVKDLTRLGRRIEDIIIVDNSPNSYLFQPQNAFPCISWYDNMNDTELAAFIPVLQKLSRCRGDIRKLLRKVCPRTPGSKLDTFRANKVLDRQLRKQVQEDTEREAKEQREREEQLKKDEANAALELAIMAAEAQKQAEIEEQKNTIDENGSKAVPKAGPSERNSVGKAESKARIKQHGAQKSTNQSSYNKKIAEKSLLQSMAQHQSNAQLGQKLKKKRDSSNGSNLNHGQKADSQPQRLHHQSRNYHGNNPAASQGAINGGSYDSQTNYKGVAPSYTMCPNNSVAHITADPSLKTATSQAALASNMAQNSGGQVSKKNQMISFNTNLASGAITSDYYKKVLGDLKIKEKLQQKQIYDMRKRNSQDHRKEGHNSQTGSKNSSSKRKRDVILVENAISEKHIRTMEKAQSYQIPGTSGHLLPQNDETVAQGNPQQIGQGKNKIDLDYYTIEKGHRGDDLAQKTFKVTHNGGSFRSNFGNGLRPLDQNPSEPRTLNVESTPKKIIRVSSKPDQVSADSQERSSEQPGSQYARRKQGQIVLKVINGAAKEGISSLSLSEQKTKSGLLVQSKSPPHRLPPSDATDVARDSYLQAQRGQIVDDGTGDQVHVSATLGQPKPSKSVSSPIFSNEINKLSHEERTLSTIQVQRESQDINSRNIRQIDDNNTAKRFSTGAAQLASVPLSYAQKGKVVDSLLSLKSGSTKMITPAAKLSINPVTDPTQKSATLQKIQKAQKASTSSRKLIQSPGLSTQLPNQILNPLQGTQNLVPLNQLSVLKSTLSLSNAGSGPGGSSVVTQFETQSMSQANMIRQRKFSHQVEQLNRANFMSMAEPKLSSPPQGSLQPKSGAPNQIKRRLSKRNLSTVPQKLPTQSESPATKSRGVAKLQAQDQHRQNYANSQSASMAVEPEHLTERQSKRKAVERIVIPQPSNIIHEKLSTAPEINEQHLDSSISAHRSNKRQSNKHLIVQSISLRNLEATSAKHKASFEKKSQTTKHADSSLKDNKDLEQLFVVGKEQALNDNNSRQMAASSNGSVGGPNSASYMNGMIQTHQRHKNRLENNLKQQHRAHKPTQIVIKRDMQTSAQSYVSLTQIANQKTSLKEVSRGSSKIQLANNPSQKDEQVQLALQNCTPRVTLEKTEVLSLKAQDHAPTSQNNRPSKGSQSKQNSKQISRTSKAQAQSNKLSSPYAQTQRQTASSRVEAQGSVGAPNNNIEVIKKSVSKVFNQAPDAINIHDKVTTLASGTSTNQKKKNSKVNSSSALLVESSEPLQQKATIVSDFNAQSSSNLPQKTNTARQGSRNSFQAAEGSGQTKHVDKKIIKMQTMQSQRASETPSQNRKSQNLGTVGGISMNTSQEHFEQLPARFDQKLVPEASQKTNAVISAQKPVRSIKKNKLNKEEHKHHSAAPSSQNNSHSVQESSGGVPQQRIVAISSIAAQSRDRNTQSRQKTSTLILGQNQSNSIANGSHKSSVHSMKQLNQIYQTKLHPPVVASVTLISAQALPNGSNAQTQSSGARRMSGPAGGPQTSTSSKIRSSQLSPRSPPAAVDSGHVSSSQPISVPLSITKTNSEITTTGPGTRKTQNRKQQ